MLGFALPGADMHAANEWFATDCLEQGIKTDLYDELADLERENRLKD